MDENIKSDKGDTVVALKYSRDNKAPKVVAKGRGYIAERILDMAAQNNVTVHTDEALAQSLNKLNLGEDIPEEMFEIVAKIYAFIDKIDVIMSEEK